MTRRFHFLLLQAIWLLAACATAGTPVPGSPSGNLPGAGGAAGVGEPEGPVGVELCDADDYRPLVGTPVAATTFAAGPRLRVFGVDDLVTQEYLPNRTNVAYDRSGTIVRVWCG